MNIHEYQAKELFEKFGVPSPRGVVATTPDEARSAAAKMGVQTVVIKAQIHAGGRGKGKFKNGFERAGSTCPSRRRTSRNWAGTCSSRRS